MKKVKRSLSLIMIMVMMLSMVTLEAQSNQYNSTFNDVDEDHYAAQYIKLMSEYGIISGYGDGNFGPNDAVSREQFAKMMVLTLGLKVDDSYLESFEDVSKKEWSFAYIEAAKHYLTGFLTHYGYNFKPKNNAVREDMAVAIVKGLGLSTEGVDLSVLNQFSDYGLISANLRPYVAKAVKEGIMIGSNGKFNPIGTLTRAEAATLLARLISEEKVVLGDTKVVFDTTTFNSKSKTAKLAVTVKTDKIYLDWTEVSKEGFKYYKVVASKADSTPKYPENGYVQAISDVTDSDTFIKPNDQVNSGDSEKLMPGVKYFIAITSVYDKESYTSNVVEVTIPKTVAISNVQKTPVLTGLVVNKEIKLSWTKTSATDFSYYKIVMSKSDSTPTYPDNGYLTYIADVNSNTFIVRENAAYNGGDFGSDVDDQELYYISITAVYGNGKYTSNVVRLSIPD